MYLRVLSTTRTGKRGATPRFWLAFRPGSGRLSEVCVVVRLVLRERGLFQTLRGIDQPASPTGGGRLTSPASQSKQMDGQTFCCLAALLCAQIRENQKNRQQHLNSDTTPAKQRDCKQPNPDLLLVADLAERYVRQMPLIIKQICLSPSVVRR